MLHSTDASHRGERLASESASQPRRRCICCGLSGTRCINEVQTDETRPHMSGRWCAECTPTEGIARCGCLCGGCEVHDYGSEAAPSTSVGHSGLWRSAHWFAVGDLLQGFHQVELDESSRIGEQISLPRRLRRSQATRALPTMFPRQRRHRQRYIAISPMGCRSSSSHQTLGRGGSRVDCPRNG